MSYLEFSDGIGDARLRGWEYAWVKMLVSEVALAVLPESTSLTLRERVVPDHYAADCAAGAVRTALSVSSVPVLTDVDGTPLDSFCLLLNTTLALGSDPLALAARLSGQGEIHAFVEGPHRGWLAGLIDAGRAAGVLRPGGDWEAVTTLLRARDDRPVVTCYSGADSFPAMPADWEPDGSDLAVSVEEVWEVWDQLPERDQWDAAVRGLRRCSADTELRPDRLRAEFGHGRSLLDLFAGEPRVRVMPPMSGR